MSRVSQVISAKQDERTLSVVAAGGDKSSAHGSATEDPVYLFVSVLLLFGPHSCAGLTMGSRHHHVAPPKYYHEDESESCFNGTNGRTHIRNFLVVFAIVATWFIYAANKDLKDGANGTGSSKGQTTLLSGSSSSIINEEDIAPIQEDAIQVLPEWHNHGRISDEANKLLRQREEKDKAEQVTEKEGGGNDENANGQG